MARPLLDINEEVVADLAFRGLSNNRIAQLLDVDDQTIINRFSKLLAKKRAERKLSLLDAQTNKALSGDSTMLIWLGKNELDQTDKVEQTHDGGLSINVVFEKLPSISDRNTSETSSGPD